MEKSNKPINKWARKQPRGAIMKPETFEDIKENAKKRYGIGEERAKKVAGKAYQKTKEAKFKKAGGKKEKTLPFMEPW